MVQDTLSLRSKSHLRLSPNVAKFGGWWGCSPRAYPFRATMGVNSDPKRRQRILP